MSMHTDITEYISDDIKYTATRTSTASDSDSDYQPGNHIYFHRELSQWCDSVKVYKKNIKCGITPTFAAILFAVFSFLSIVPMMVQNFPTAGLLIFITLPVFVFTAVFAAFKITGEKQIFTVQKNLNTVVGIRDCKNEAEKRIVFVCSSEGADDEKPFPVSNSAMYLCIGISLLTVLFNFLCILSQVMGSESYPSDFVFFMPISIIVYGLLLFIWSRKRRDKHTGVASCFCVNKAVKFLSENGIRFDDTQVYCIIGENGKYGMKAASKLLREQFPFKGETVLIAVDIDAPSSLHISTPATAASQWKRTITDACASSGQMHESIQTDVFGYFSRIKNKTALVTLSNFSKASAETDIPQKLAGSISFLIDSALIYGKYENS